MTQHEDLELLRALAAREQHDQLKQPADDHVNDRHDQERPPQDGLPTLPRPQQGRPRPPPSADRIYAPHAFELGSIIADKRGLRRSDINDLNHALRRMLWNRGDYVRPIELVHQRPQPSKLTPRNTAPGLADRPRSRLTCIAQSQRTNI